MTNETDHDVNVITAHVALAEQAGQDATLTVANGVGATVDKRVEQYVKIRDEIARRKKLYEEDVAPLVEVQNMLTGWLQNFLEQAGGESIKTSHGTAYSTTKYSASLADADAFMKFVKANEAYDLLDKKANVTACRDYVEAHNQPPPGVSLSAMKTIGVRRASGR